MARNVAIQILRGIAAHIPALDNGEFYLATDTGQLYVGLNGINFKLGIQAMAAVEINGNANPNNYIEPNADGSLIVKGTGAATVALDGTDATGVSPAAGAVGIRGWLSSLFGFFSATAAAKGTLGTLVLSVQEPKDINRTKVVLTLTKATGVTSEALVSMTIKKGDATTTTGTSYTVTAGKTLRLQSMFLGVTNITTATIVNVAARLREGAAGGGALSVASDIISQLEAGVVGSPAALQLSGQSWKVFPDGVEIAGGQTIGISELASSANSAVSIELTGYEYYRSIMASGKGNTNSINFLQGLFQATFSEISSIFANSGSPLTNLYVSLHTANPGATGNQTTSEAAYTSYARQAVSRDSSGWSISSETISNVAAVTFPTATGGSESETYAGIGTLSTGSGNLLYFGALTSPLAVSSGITPSFAIGALTVTES